MSGVLISTIFEKSDATKLSIRDFNIQKIIFLVDKEAKDAQLQSIDLLKRTFSNTMEIVEKKVELYDILSVAKDAVRIIDSIEMGDKIYVDISQGRKTQAFGLLLACYSRPQRIESIVYWGEDKKLTVLPKFSFAIDDVEKSILKEIESVESISELIKKLKLSRSKLYRLIKNLENKELIKKEIGKYILTDAGKIARM